MEEEYKGLEKKVNKILWTHKFSNLKEADHLREQIFECCQKLEDNGFGMLEDANNPGKIDSSCSIVCPDGSVFTPKQIEDYLMERKANFNSENEKDMKMYNINMYYFGFKESFNCLEE